MAVGICRHSYKAPVSKSEAIFQCHCITLDTSYDNDHNYGNYDNSYDKDDNNDSLEDNDNDCTLQMTKC